MLCNFIEITLPNGCSFVSLLHIFRTCFLKKTSGWLLLNKAIPITLKITGKTFPRESFIMTSLNINIPLRLLRDFWNSHYPEHFCRIKTYLWEWRILYFFHKIMEFGREAVSLIHLRNLVRKTLQTSQKKKHSRLTRHKLLVDKVADLKPALNLA